MCSLSLFVVLRSKCEPSRTGWRRVVPPVAASGGAAGGGAAAAGAIGASAARHVHNCVVVSLYADLQSVRTWFCAERIQDPVDVLQVLRVETYLKHYLFVRKKIKKKKISKGREKNFFSQFSQNSLPHMSRMWCHRCASGNMTNTVKKKNISCKLKNLTKKWEAILAYTTTEHFRMA